MNVNEFWSPLLSPNPNPIPRGSLPCRFQKQTRLSALHVLLLLVILLSSTTSTTTAQQSPLEGRRLLRSSSTTPTVSTKIVGGQPAEVPFPFFVQWQDRGCGGSLIHDDIMLTAAHCYIGTADQVANPFERLVHIGGTQLNVAPVTRTMTRQIPHPQFELIDVTNDYQDDTTLEYDFMLVKLNQSALLQDDNEVPQVYPIAVNTNPDWPLPGDALTVMGFGVEHPTAWDLSERLQQVQVTALANDECVDLYNDTLDVFVDVMFCAAEPGKDSCQGDSGGPILYAGDANNPPLQVGVVSFGHSCGAEDFPGVYSRLSAVQSWIQKTICQWTCHLPDYCETDYPDIVQHPCATDPLGRPAGPLDLQLQIAFDQYPSEQAILVEHVATATELLFRPYGYYNQSLPDTETEGETGNEDDTETQTSIPIPVQTSKQARQPPPPLVETFDFIQQPAGTFRISVGDLGRDGICCNYGAGNLTLFLIDRSTDSGNPTRTILWSNNGQFGSKVEAEIELDEDGSVIRQYTATTANGSQQEEVDPDSTNDEGESDNGDGNEEDNNNGNNDIGLGSGSDNQDDEEEDEDSEGDGNGEQDDTSTWSPEDGVLPSPGELFDLVLGENDEQEEEATSSPTSSSSELFEVKEERIGQGPNHPSYDIINPP